MSEEARHAENLGPPHGGGRRLRALIRKEFLQILRDPSSIAIAFLLPVVLLLLNGYGVSLDAVHVPVAIVADEPSAETAAFIGSFMQSRYFAPVIMGQLHDAEEALRARRVDAIIRLRQDFPRRFWTDSAPIQVVVNGTDANTAQEVLSYVDGAWAKWLEHEADQAGMAAGAAPSPPVQIEQRVWFNAEMRSTNYLVPGLVAQIMTLIGALLTAMVMAREWERGTMEAMLVTPTTMSEIMAGKLVPYFILGMGGMALSVAMAVWLFDVPLRGSLLVLFGASSLFMLAALGMGLLISELARNQFLAGQTAIVVTFLPAFILSGFIFDIGSMPPAVKVITYLVAARYFVSILQTVFLAGDVWSVILPNSLALAGMAVLFVGLTWRLSRKRLD